MRTSFAMAAGLVAVASAGTTTITDTVDVTITSCAPSVTNCPYKADPTSTGTWADWSVSASTTTTSSYDPTWSDWVSSTTSTSSSYDPTWSDWVSTTTSTTTKPVKAATTSSSTTWDPTWSDWVSSSTTLSTTTSKPVSAVTTSYTSYAWSSSVTPVKAASTTTSAIWASAYSGSPVSPAIATFTGAANVNTGSFALAGLAAAAALVMA